MHTGISIACSRRRSFSFAGNAERIKQTHFYNEHRGKKCGCIAAGTEATLSQRRGFVTAHRFTSDKHVYFVLMRTQEDSIAGMLLRSKQEGRSPSSLYLAKIAPAGSGIDSSIPVGVVKELKLEPRKN